ncbi:glycosyltransferase [Geminocystis sp.]|uniref:glycosyltransferase n=1 Tax=Geminocystis sp. TaxID=2664100 RepID=UPI0035947450
MRILLVQFECLNWLQGRSYPYCLNFAFKESLEKLGIEVVIITTPWLPYLERICEGKIFDQIWLNDLSHFADFNLDLSIVKNLAPVRLGFITESLEYDEKAYQNFSWLQYRRQGIEKQLENVTHIVAVDEEDVINLHQRLKLPTMWLPVSIPEGLICTQNKPSRYNLAFFSGSLYGERQELLENKKLNSLLKQNHLSNDNYIYSLFFNLLPRHQYLRLDKFTNYPLHLIYPLYLQLLRNIRYSAFMAWQKQVLQSGFAVVNLPHLVKGYSTRVIEGIAALRPVISWEIPDRPLNKAIFENGKEILLYSTAEELGEQINYILSNPQLAEKIAINAQEKVKKWHTTEKRMTQILFWIEHNETPNYGIN